MTAQPARKNSALTSPDAAKVSIDILMDLLSKPAWRTGDGRSPWLACLAAQVLALDPACKARRLLDSMTAVHGNDLTGLRGTMAQLGYYSDTLQVAMNEIDPRLLPCLFIPDGKEDAPYVIFFAKRWRIQRLRQRTPRYTRPAAPSR